MTTCCYGTCTSIQMPFSRLAFFNLPKDERRQIWINNSGNHYLSEIGPTKVRFFCELHFRECDIRRQFNRCTLRRDAVPLRFNEEEYSEKNVVELEKLRVEICETNEECVGEDKSRSPHDELEFSMDIINGGLQLENGIDIEDTDDAAFDSRLQDEQFIDESNSGFVEIDYTSECNESDAEPDLLDNRNSNSEDHNRNPSSPLPAYPIQRALNRRIRLRQIRESSRAHQLKPRTRNKFIVPAVPDHRSEDTYFALSLVGPLQRLNARQRALAKLNIVQYLTELAFKPGA